MYPTADVQLYRKGLSIPAPDCKISSWNETLTYDSNLLRRHKRIDW
jgi:hypothetical protein